MARIMRGGAADRSGESNCVNVVHHNAMCFLFLLKLPIQQNFLISADADREVRRLSGATPYELSTENKSLRLVPRDCIFPDYK